MAPSNGDTVLRSVLFCLVLMSVLVSESECLRVYHRLELLRLRGVSASLNRPSLLFYPGVFNLDYTLHSSGPVQNKGRGEVVPALWYAFGDALYDLHFPVSYCQTFDLFVTRQMNFSILLTRERILKTVLSFVLRKHG